MFGFIELIHRLHGPRLADHDDIAAHTEEINLWFKDVDLRNSDGTHVTCEEEINFEEDAIGAGYCISSRDELGKNFF